VPAARKLLVVNLYYPPDIASTGQLAADICTDLARRGIEVHVVAGQPSYTAKAESAPSEEIRDGVHVHRVGLGGTRGREKMSTRVTGYLRFFWGAWRVAGALAKRERFDGILTFHNPPIVGLIGANLAQRHTVHYVYALYDIHPDVLVATHWALPAPLVWAWQAANRWIMRRANAIIVLGEGMKQTLVQRHGVPAEKVRIIPIWGRPELDSSAASSTVRRELGVQEGELLLLYAGNMGVQQQVEPILDAAAALRDQPVRFLFIGDGVQRERLVRRVENEKLERVRFLPFQEESRFVQIVAAADACLVALWPGMERFCVPSRAYTLLSAGRPLITLMAPEADVAQLVRDARCGWNVTNGDELAGLLRDLIRTPGDLNEMGRRGRDVYESQYQRSRVIEEYAKVLAG
jgi:glycosyltransferase involved in cell wall biosynthesis